jgi:hypothetical protein
LKSGKPKKSKTELLNHITSSLEQYLNETIATHPKFSEIERRVSRLEAIVKIDRLSKSENSKKTPRYYYEAGSIIADTVSRWNVNDKITAKTIAEATGFPERHITLALKIFKHFENNPDKLDGLAMSDILKMIKTAPLKGGE